VLTAEVVLAEIIAMAGVYHTTASKLHEDADEFPLDLGNAFLRFKMNESADSAALSSNEARAACFGVHLNDQPQAISAA
jgi:hypothetical protein